MNYLDLNDLADELGALEDEEAELEDGDELTAEASGRLADLQDLQGELGGDLATYARGECTLIPEPEFTDYAQELATEVGDIKSTDPLYAYIDWERWADDLRHDYTEVDFDGYTYLIQAY